MSGEAKPKTKLTGEELEYHREVVAGVKQAAALHAEAAELEAAFRAWGKRLHRKYDLGVTGNVDEEGNISGGVQQAPADGASALGEEASSDAGLH